MKYIVDLKNVNLSHVKEVGGKNASTGEMIQNLAHLPINVPDGFAVTTAAYKAFLARDELEQKIATLLKTLRKKDDIKQLNHVSQAIKRHIMQLPFFPQLEKEIRLAYAKFQQTPVAVRSSAINEDMATASFAGAQDTYLNVKGIKNVLHAIKAVYASLYSSRAIAYRIDQPLQHGECAISIGVQPMVRSDKGVSGVIFTLDTESGFDQVILLSAAYGLGEGIVQGQMNTDEFLVYKPALEKNKLAILQRKCGDKAVKMVYHNGKVLHESTRLVAVKQCDRLRFCLTDKEVTTLANMALLLEKHYGKPMDIEWAKDGVNGQFYILQARPETVASQQNKTQVIEHFTLTQQGKTLASGQSIGQRIGKGRAHVMLDPKKMSAMKRGEVLITDMTDPDWEPAMKMASAIVTNRGGRTCHAAIIARELGIPALVGTGNATKQIKSASPITVSCAEGQLGHVYAGDLAYTVQQIAVQKMPTLPIKITMNIGSPEKAFANQFLPNEGVGLARIEFIISNSIGIHPNAALKVATLPKKIKQQLLLKTAAYKNPVEFYIEKLREGMSVIAAAFYPKEVIYRFSDFKTNEYANLLGGQLFEPKEENPMLGFRGASRYTSDSFRDAFALECKAFKRMRDDMGLHNAQLMIPFVRTVAELRAVIALLEKQGLKRGKQGLKIYMMCELPSNVLLAAEFLPYVDGYSIGSNDLTQLTLGLDRDSSLVAPLFDERNAAVKKLLHTVIAECNRQGKYIGICGQGPSDYPDFALWLMQQGIQCLSLNPDTIVATWMLLAAKDDA